VMYLGIRTDSPEAEFYLYDGQKQVAKHRWQADRQLAKDLLGQLEAFLTKCDTSFDELNGLFVFQGPGSFTGLRIGITVCNTAAYALDIPVVAVQGDAWVDGALKRLAAGEDDKVVLPFYGAEARITLPKK